MTRIHVSEQCYIKLHIHSWALCLRTCLENLFFHELPADQGKMTNQLCWQLRENCWQDRKIFQQTRKRNTILAHKVLTELRTSFAFVKKTDWRWFATNCWQTVCKPHTNYTNIVLANWFANQMYMQLYISLR